MTSSPHIGQLLRDAFELFEQRLGEGLPEAVTAGVRPTHNAVLRHLDPDGTRASELARRSGLTRQALSLIVADLESLGLVERVDDPGDKRAKIIRYTRKGRRLFARSRAVIDEIEAEFEERVGVRRYAEMRKGLAALRDA